MIALRRKGTISISLASSVTAGTLASASAGSLFGGFDGPFAALFPGAVHSPRLDDVHDRKRGKVHLRRRDRRPGLGAIPDHRCRTQGPLEPRTCARRTLYASHFPNRADLVSLCAGDPPPTPLIIIPFAHAP